MLRIVKKFPAVRAFGGAPPRAGGPWRSEPIQLPPEATHFAAAASVLDASGPARLRISLETGGPQHWTSEPLLDLPALGTAWVGWRPIPAGGLWVTVEERTSGWALLGPVELIPAVGEDDPGAAGVPAVSR
jgi:hypothetical protein